MPTKETTAKETKAIGKRRKATSESIDDVDEPVTSKAQAAKRKRTATTKDTKLAKLKKDVNDNELVNEENDEPDLDNGRIA